MLFFLILNLFVFCLKPNYSNIPAYYVKKRKLVAFFVDYYMIQEILQQLQMLVFYNIR